MQVHEICRLTGLTKKAIEYYQAKGLVSPKVNENGYREFSDWDLVRLREIALFRKLDLNTDEIRQVLESKDKKGTLIAIKQAKEIEARAKLKRLELLAMLIEGGDTEEIQDGLNLLEQQATIKEKLLRAFPGYLGRYISIHFGQFLQEPIKTEEQKLLYEKLVDFLDNMESMEIPEELEGILKEADRFMDDEQLGELSVHLQKAYEDFDAYWENHKDALKQYAEFRLSEEYADSETAQLMNWFRKFAEASGYYEIFIPTMRKLSPSYDRYYKRMLEANEQLIAKMPEFNPISKN